MAIAVLMGLGVTGRAVAEALRERDVDVVAFDDAPGEELLAWGRANGITIESADESSLRESLTDAEFAVPAPGLPDHHPLFDAAAEAGVDIVSEFDLAQQWDSRPAIAVTGTDGKTTVVTLIQRMLEASGIATAAVGNTDTPWVRALDDDRVEVFVVEASSFRLGHSRDFSPEVGVWLNFGADHLDTHSSLERYEAAKASIWARLAPDALALANREDPVVWCHARRLRRGCMESFGLSSERPHGVDAGELIVAGEPLVAVAELPRNLPHDIANGLAAAAAALHVGATRSACADVLRSFTGLPHRLELVAEREGIRWVNDSKATTPHAAAAGLAGFDSVVLLAGGRNKGLAFDDLTVHAAKVRHLVTFGEAADLVADAFGARTASTRVETMQQAVEEAARVATRGDVVLLAPACASFDQYRNYGERGDDFRELVRSHHEATHRGDT